MGTSIKFILGEQLSNFWKNDITKLINEDLYKNKDKYLFNLASNEYFESIDIKKLNQGLSTLILKNKNNNFKWDRYDDKKNAEVVWQNF